MSTEMIDRYEVREQLGRGGMATVYHAYDPRFERDVAIKVMPREFLHDPTFRARFEREAKTIAALEHSAIVSVHDFGEHEGQPFLVMRFMPGGSLSDRIKQGPTSLSETTQIMERISAALDSAHRRNVIHRDVKPGNILFDQEGDAYLSDFGIVKVSEATAQLTGSGIVGTPSYMAPEMADRGGVSPLIDIYALGVTLYQMVTGRLPYDADTPMGMLMAHMGRPIPDARELRPDLPAGVQAVIERAMAKDPAQRYQSAGELTTDLRAVIEGGEVYLAPTEVPTAPTAPDVPMDVTEPAAPPEPEWATVEQTPAETMPAQPATGAPPMGVERPEPRPARRGIPGWVWVVAGLLVAGLILVGGIILLGPAIGDMLGGPDGTTEAPAAEAPEEKATEEETPPEKEAPAADVGGEEGGIPPECDVDEWSCVVVKPGEPILIGYAGPTTGDYAAFGTDISQGGLIAINDFDEFDGFRFELVIEDTQGSPELGAAVANKWFAGGKVVAVAGHTFSGSTEAAIPIYDAAGIPMLSPSATNPNLTQIGSRVFNRIAFTDTTQGEAAARYLREKLGVSRLAVIHDGGAYGQGLAEVVAETFSALGGQVVAFEAITPGETDYSAPLAAVGAAGPEAIYFGGYDADAAVLVNQLGIAGLGDVVFFGCDGTYGQNFLDLTGANSEGNYATSLVPPGSPARDKFDAAYEEMWGIRPGTLSPFTWNGYDVVAALIHAVKQVAIKRGDTLYIPRGALVDAVRNLRGFPGLSGEITCNANGECNTAGPTFFRVENGRWVGAP